MSQGVTLDQHWNAWILLHETRDILTQFRSEELSRYGITTAQAGLLNCLVYFGGKATIDDLAKSLLRRHHTVSTALTRMEAKGLVRKRRDSQSGSRYRITLTETGKQVHEEAQRGETVHEMMSCLSEEELRQLSQLLKKVWVRAMEMDVSRRGLHLP